VRFILWNSPRYLGVVVINTSMNAAAVRTDTGCTVCCVYLMSLLQTKCKSKEECKIVLVSLWVPVFSEVSNYSDVEFGLAVKTRTSLGILWHSYPCINC
jgi:hypothetical protein